MSNAMLLYAHLTDKELVDRVKSGREECYEVLVRRHVAGLYRVCRMYGFSQNEAERLLACAFVEAYSRLNSYTHKTGWRSWLTRLMIDLCMEERKDRQTDPASAFLADSSREDHILRDRRAGSAEVCIGELPVALRSVYILTEVEGFTPKETAWLLATTEDHVRLRLTRAKESLNKSLRKWYQATDIYHLDIYSSNRIAAAVMQAISTPNRTVPGRYQHRSMKQEIS